MLLPILGPLEEISQSIGDVFKCTHTKYQKLCDNKQKMTKETTATVEEIEVVMIFLVVLDLML
jgi:hypothetical protein